MFKTQLPSSRLSLTYEFQLPAVVKKPSTSAHDVASKKAAELSGLIDTSQVSASACSVTDLTISTIHQLPFDSSKYVADGERGVHFEFFYDQKEAKSAVRIVNTLGEDPKLCIDGVLASRLAFMTMEILEKGSDEFSEVSPGAREGKFPPLKFGLRQQFNFLCEIMPGTLFRILFAFMSMFIDKILCRKPPTDPTLVNDAKSLFRFYESDQAATRAELKLFCPEPNDVAKFDEKPFRKFLSLVESWRCAQKLAGYFYLMNFSPLVAPGVTSNVDDIVDLDARYRGAFDRPGGGPPPPLWVVSNPQMARRVFFNNYGIHKHEFSAKPVAFAWDWLELAAPLNGAGCITVNGVFMCWVRGLPSALQKGDFAGSLGEPVAQFSQNTKWFECNGLPKSIAPKK